MQLEGVLEDELDKKSYPFKNLQHQGTWYVVVFAGAMFLHNHECNCSSVFSRSTRYVCQHYCAADCVYRLACHCRSTLLQSEKRQIWVPKPSAVIVPKVPKGKVRSPVKHT